MSPPTLARVWPHHRDAPAHSRRCQRHDNSPWLWAPGAWPGAPARPPRAATAAPCTVPRSPRPLAGVWPCNGDRPSHAYLRQWLSPAPTLPMRPGRSPGAPGVAGTQTTHCDAPVAPHTTRTPALSIDSRQETPPATRLVGKKKGRLLHDLAFHPPPLIFLPPPRPCFLRRTQTTVAWKGLHALLRQGPFPLPQHGGMQAQFRAAALTP